MAGQLASRWAQLPVRPDPDPVTAPTATEEGHTATRAPRAQLTSADEGGGPGLPAARRGRDPEAAVDSNETRRQGVVEDGDVSGGRNGSKASQQACAKGSSRARARAPFVAGDACRGTPTSRCAGAGTRLAASVHGAPGPELETLVGGGTGTNQWLALSSHRITPFSHSPAIKDANNAKEFESSPPSRLPRDPLAPEPVPCSDTSREGQRVKVGGVSLLPGGDSRTEINP